MPPPKDPLHQPRLDRKALVVRHNSLIESRHRLTIPERRFMLWLVSQVNQEDEAFKAYRVGVTEFVEFAGLEGNASYYRRISEITDSLSRRTLVIRDEEAEEDTYTPWFLQIKYKWGEGHIDTMLNPALAPFLLQLKSHYTTITLEYALLLRSSYSGRIYDLLKQYEPIGERTVRIDDLRGMLDLGTKYRKYKDFRIRVIEPAQKEINGKTDISFGWKAVKEGRRFATIIFTIWNETPHVSLDNREETEPRAQRLYRTLCSLGIAEKAARSLISEHDDERIEWHIREYTVRKASGRVKTTGWLVRAIRADYRPKDPPGRPAESTGIIPEGKPVTPPPLKLIDLLRPETLRESHRIAGKALLDWDSTRELYCERVNRTGRPDDLDRDFIAFFKARAG